MKKILLCLIYCLSIIPCAEPVFAQGKSSMEWYKKVYGSLSESDHPLAAKAHEVFERVTAAADKPGDRYPKLLIIPTTSDPWALCLKDGGIVLSQTALEFCYHGVPEPIGSARLAFVLGHEIAHLAKGDFWHAAIIEFMAHYDSQAKGLEAFNKLVRHPEANKTRELRADYHGMLYAFMAGYSPQVIVKQEDVNFFAAWTNQLSGKIAYDEPSYPSPTLRAIHLLTLLKNINSQIEIFELGLRLYQKGDYSNALACLTYVQRQFPSREVLNNVGLIHFQRAMDYLSGFDKEKARRFRLATILDTETRAEMRSGDNDISDKAFKIEIEAAVTSFQDACRRDAHYVPDRFYLGLRLYQKGDYSNALAILDEAGKIGQDDLDVLNNNAVALYQFGRSKKIDTTGQAIEILQGILRADPDHAAALYNLGSVLFEQNRRSEVSEKWLRYLKNEPNGRFAERAREFLGKAAGRSGNNKPIQYQTPPPFALGSVDDCIQNKLKTFSATALESVELDGIYYSKGDVRVLVARGFVKLVESADAKRTKLPEILSRYGRPKRTIAAASGLQTYVYDDFALDIREDKVIKVVYFQ